MKSLIIALPAFFIISCKPPAESPQIAGFQLTGTDPEALMAWYIQNLELGRSPNPNELRLFDPATALYFKQSFPADTTAGENHLQPGFFKFGFKTSRFDELVEVMKGNGTRFRGDVFYDSNLKMRAVVVLDPEGNRVQFFEDREAPALIPFFFSVMVKDIEASVAWYQGQFGFTTSFDLDIPQRAIQLRLLGKDGLLLELIHRSGMAEKKHPGSGISAVVLTTDREIQDPDGNRFLPTHR